MKISKEIYDKIAMYAQLAIDNQNIELEILFSQNRITKDQFDRLYTVLAKKYNIIDYPEVLDITNTEKHFSNRISISGVPNIKQYCKKNEITDLEYTILKKTRWIEQIKTKAEPIIIPNYSLKLNLKTEENINNNEDLIKNIKNSQKTYRLKKRFSFITDDNLFRYDLTIVKTSSRERGNYGNYIPALNIKSSNILKNKPIYEIEMEYIGNQKLEIDKFIELTFKNVKPVLQALQNNECIISDNDVKKVSIEYMKLVFPKIDIPANFKFVRKYFIGPQPVTLEMNNVRKYQSDTNIININTAYSVTDKADGERHLLFINSEGKVYMINTKMEIKYTGLVCIKMADSVLDGEFIKYNKKGKSLDNPLFGVFDIYFYNNIDYRYRILSNPSVIKDDGVKELLYTESEEGRYQILDRLFKKLEITSEKKQKNPIKVFKKNFEFVYGKNDDIFIKSSIILDNSLSSQYYTDGLIYTPINYGVLQNEEGQQEIVQYSGKTWNRVFKWKPPEENSIDFKVDFQEEKVEGKYLKDKIDYEYEGERIRKYKTCILKVGLDETDRAAYNTCRALYKGKELDIKKGKSSYTDVEFKPTNPYSNTAFLTNLYLSENDVPKCIKDNSEIRKNDIVEFAFNLEKSQWIPLRIRQDKVKPNYFKIANSVWSSINNPITENIIRTGNDIPDIQDSEELYWSGDKSNIKYDKYTKNMRNFHNLFVKNKLITGVAKEGNTLLDIGCGKGQDISRWCYAKLSFVLGIDNTKTAIEDPQDGACVRYQNYLKTGSCKTVPDAIFIYGDCSKKILNGDCGNNDENKLLLKTLAGNIKKEEIKDNDLVPLLGKINDKFNIISSQFTIHYLLESEEKSTNFIDNISDNLKDNGYFIGTTFDGKTVFNKLKILEEDEFVSKSVESALIWKITKKYSHNTYEKELTYPIDVYFGSIGQKHTEYLVNFDLLVEKLKEKNITLVKKSEANKIGLPNATGTFNELFKNYSKIEDLSDLEKEYSALNRWFIFKKNTGKKTKVKVVPKTITLKR